MAKIEDEFPSLVDGKIWSMGDDWRIQVIGLKTEVAKFAILHNLKISGEAFGENNKPHKFLLNASFKTPGAAKKWAKKNSFLFLKD